MWSEHFLNYLSMTEKQKCCPSVWHSSALTVTNSNRQYHMTVNKIKGIHLWAHLRPQRLTQRVSLPGCWKLAEDLKTGGLTGPHWVSDQSGSHVGAASYLDLNSLHGLKLSGSSADIRWDFIFYDVSFRWKNNFIIQTISEDAGFVFSLVLADTVYAPIHST